MKEKDFLPSEAEILKAQKECAFHMVLYLVELAHKFRLVVEDKYDFNEALEELINMIKVTKE